MLPAPPEPAATAATGEAGPTAAAAPAAERSRRRGLAPTESGPAPAPRLQAVKGLAQGEDRRPLGGVAVELGLLAAGRRHPGVEVTSGADGTFEALLEVPSALLEGGAVLLYGRPAESGFARTPVTAPLPPGDGAGAATVELRVRFLPGGTLEGRVLTAQGAPLPGDAAGTVQLARLKGSQPTPAGRGELGPGGHFTLPLDERGRYQVQAQVPQLGSALLGDLELDPAADPEPVELRLAGTGELAGVLVDPLGQPVGHFPVGLFPEALLSADPGPAERPPLKVTRYWKIREVRGEGLRSGLLRTDAAGRFHFRGLRGGGYLLAGPAEHAWLGSPAVGSGPRQELRSELVSTGTLDLRLIVAHHRLAVRAVGAGGEALPAEPIFCALADPGGRVVPHGEEPDRWEDGAGGVQFHVRPGRAYVVGYAARDRALREEAVSIPEAPYRTDVLLQLGPRLAPGRLLLLAVGRTGQPLPAGGWVRIRSLQTGFERRVSEPSWTDLLGGEPSSDPVEYELAPGRYEVVVHDRRADSHGLRWPSRPPFGAPVTAEFEVHPGLETRLQLAVRTGGHLALRLPAPEPPAGSAPAAGEPAPEVSLELRPSGGGAPLPLELYVVRDLPPFGAPRERVPLGARALSATLIPAGRWLLRATAPGHEPAELPVEIERDRISEYVLSLQPRP